MTPNGSSPPPASKSGEAADASIRSTRILLVDDDETFRESLSLTLADEGFGVTAMPDGASALACLANGELPDVILLDWRMPGMSGLEVLQTLRKRGIETPVIFLTGLTDDVFEEKALASGAVDFIDKSRRWPILVRRIELVAEATAATAERLESPEAVRVGSLELRFDINRARWAGHTLDLTLTEFRILALLANSAGEDISYRAVYDLVRGKDFAAGQGPEGYRVNVRTFIKRIRNKFRALDPDFDRIKNYAGFGYRWVVDEASAPEA